MMPCIHIIYRHTLSLWEKLARFWKTSGIIFLVASIIFLVARMNYGNEPKKEYQVAPLFFRLAKKHDRNRKKPNSGYTVPLFPTTGRRTSRRGTNKTIMQEIVLYAAYVGSIGKRTNRWHWYVGGIFSIIGARGERGTSTATLSKYIAWHATRAVIANLVFRGVRPERTSSYIVYVTT